MSRINSLRIALTNSCNLNCFYCNKEGYMAKYNHINIENVILLIQYAIMYFDIKEVKYTGGEPFLSDNLIQLVSKVHKTYKKLTQSIVTNGTYPELLKQLITKNIPIEITISLPTIDNDKYFQLTNHKEVNKVIKTLQYLIESNHSIKINYVLIKTVNDDYKNIEAMIDKYVIPYQKISLRFIQPCHNNINKLDAKYNVTDAEFKALVDKKGFIEISNDRSKIIYTNGSRKITFFKFFCYESCSRCPHDKNSIWAYTDGTISICCYDNFSFSRKIEKFEATEIGRAFVELCNIHETNNS